MLFTLDKLIAKFVKQLQTLMADDLCSKLYDLFRYEASRSAKFRYHANTTMHAADRVLLCMQMNSAVPAKHVTTRIPSKVCPAYEAKQHPSRCLD